MGRRIEVRGLHAPVEILRDRVGAGRLAEVLGRSALEADRFLRTLGARRAAQANLGRLDEDTRRHLDAYTAGVNAFLGTDPVLPPEYLLLEVKPEAWSPVDSLAWLKMMAWDLGANWRNELLRMRLAKVLPMARIHEFLPPYPGDAPPQIRELKDLYQDKEPPRVAEAENRDRPHFWNSQKWGLSPFSASFARIQLDVVSLAVHELLPVLLSAKPKTRKQAKS